MAVSGKTPAPIEAPYSLTSDHPLDVPAVTKAMAEREHVLFEERDSRFQSVYQAGPVTRANTALGAFSTPIKVELPEVKANQLIEVRAFGTVKESLEASGGSTGKFSIKVGATSLEEELWSLNGNVNLTANTGINFSTSGLSSFFLKSTGLVRNAFVPAGASLLPLVFIAESEATNVVVELQGASHSTGTITAEKVWLQARVFG